MENKKFRSRLFGFRKSDVCEYIQGMNTEFSERLQQKEIECQNLRKELYELRRQTAEMQAEKDKVAGALIQAEEKAKEIVSATEQEAEDKRRMERELEEIFAADPDPLSIAPYDNLQPVMFELNGILQSTPEYSLSFGTVDTEEPIIRRQIMLSYTSGSYEAAKEVLQRLHDSAYRCMLDSVSISIGERDEGSVSVSASLVFFEYQ